MTELQIFVPVIVSQLAWTVAFIFVAAVAISAYDTVKRSAVAGATSASSLAMQSPIWSDRESCHEPRPSEKRHPAETWLLEPTDAGETMSSVERSGNKEWSSSRLDPD